MKSERPKHSIYPHSLDYCDYCAKKKEELRRNHTILNRIRQTGSAEEEEQKRIESEIVTLTSELEAHCQNAKKSHDYYNETKKRCKEEWKEIMALESKEGRTEEEEVTLQSLKHNFSAVLSADCQMQKLVSYWRHSPQPGATYYLKKMSHDIFGIVDHSDERSTLYIFDETVGPKKTLTIQYLCSCSTSEIMREYPAGLNLYTYSLITLEVHTKMHSSWMGHENGAAWSYRLLAVLFPYSWACEV